uniref:Uncharacterized protein n=1 Tax=Avena sativa TaxID=4498 RepID=A0ACD5XRM5_AVESA
MDPPPSFPPAASPIAQTAPSMATTAAAKAARRRSVRSRGGGGGKRRRIATEETGGWASLPDDIVRLVADRVLIAGDVVDYISLRATCSDWRASTDSPLLAGHRHLRARGWAALCDGDAARPDDVHEVAFFKPATGRRLRLRLPDLRGNRIVAFSAGLLVLLHKRYTTVRVLHPFTRAVLLDLPSLAPAFRLVGGTRDSLLRMNAAVFTSPAAATATTAAAIDAVVAWFPGTHAVLFAKPGDAGWDAVVLDIDLQSVLAFRGRLYATTKTSTNILQVYPPTYDNTFPVDTPIPDALGDPSSCLYFLVRSHGRMLLAIRHYASTPTVHTAFKVFEVHLDRRRLETASAAARSSSARTGVCPSRPGTCRPSAGTLSTAPLSTASSASLSAVAPPAASGSRPCAPCGHSPLSIISSHTAIIFSGREGSCFTSIRIYLIV